MTYIVIAILTATVLSIILGFIFNKTEDEKVNGLREIYDVSADGVIAYVSYDEGNPGIYFHANDHDEQAVELWEEENINDIAFSPDGETLAYTVNEKEDARIYTMDVDSLESQALFQDEAYITEIAYNPEDSEQLFFLGADTFENYSPVAQAKPHEFDIYSLDTNSEEETKHTNLSTYDMQGFGISTDGENVYVTMVDDEQIETPEDSFSADEEIFRIPLDDPEEKQPLDLPAGDTYDPVVLPDETGIIYKAVAGKDEIGTYQYEVFYYDLDTKETDQITHVKSYAGSAVLAEDGETVYFIEDSAFAQKHPDYSLHKINLDGSEETHIPLEYE